MLGFLVNTGALLGGETDGFIVGITSTVGVCEGSIDGVSVKWWEGSPEGTLLGFTIGIFDKSLTGITVEGSTDGTVLGVEVGCMLGIPVTG